jgi:hypothetical protein
VTLQFKEKVVPFIVGVHYYVRKKNLVMVILSKLDPLHWFESILQALYVFFAHSPKKFLEF